MRMVIIYEVGCGRAGLMDHILLVHEPRGQTSYSSYSLLCLVSAQLAVVLFSGSVIVGTFFFHVSGPLSPSCSWRPMDDRHEQG